VQLAECDLNKGADITGSFRRRGLQEAEPVTLMLPLAYLSAAHSCRLWHTCLQWPS